MDSGNNNEENLLCEEHSDVIVEEQYQESLNSRENNESNPDKQDIEETETDLNKLQPDHM